MFQPDYSDVTVPINFGLTDPTAKGPAVPTYEYLCTDCGEPLEIVQSIHEPSLTHCPKCGGRLRKVFGNVGVVFKGSGFYKTDSRSADAKKKKAAASSDSKDSGDSKTTGDSGAKKTDGASTPTTGEAASSTKAADSASSSDGGSKGTPTKQSSAPTSS